MNDLIKYIEDCIKECEEAKKLFTSISTIGYWEGRKDSYQDVLHQLKNGNYKVVIDASLIHDSVKVEVNKDV